MGVGGKMMKHKSDETPKIRTDMPCSEIWLRSYGLLSAVKDLGR